MLDLELGRGSSANVVVPAHAVTHRTHREVVSETLGVVPITRVLSSGIQVVEAKVVQLDKLLGKTARPHHGLARGLGRDIHEFRAHPVTALVVGIFLCLPVFLGSPPSDKSGARHAIDDFLGVHGRGFNERHGVHRYSARWSEITP